VLLQTPSLGQRAAVVLSVARDGIKVMFDDGDVNMVKWNQFVSKLNHLKKAANDANFNAVMRQD